MGKLTYFKGIFYIIAMLVYQRAVPLTIFHLAKAMDSPGAREFAAGGFLRPPELCEGR